ncbi:MAG: hypothetical protein JNK74_10165 [Candidatus Hydrogenedentes bacterium]|nr:hypothetical protein [Candidatus Hydrogenedentota bacterium]
MSSYFLAAMIAGVALIHGAEPAADAPVTQEAAPVETPAPPAAEPGALPNIDLPAQTTQGEPAPPQTLGEPKAETPTGTTPTTTTVSEVPATEAPLEELVRPTEKKDRSGKKVAAFWFITTGK